MSLAGWGVARGALRAVEQAQQRVELRLDGGFRAAGRACRALAGDAAAHPLHGLLDARAVKRLQQVIDGVHVEGAHGVLVIGRGKDDLRQRLGVVRPWPRRFCRAALHQPLDHGKAVQPRHLHIEKDQVGMVLLDQVNGLDAVGSLRHHIHAAHLVEQILQLVAGQLFVVDDERGDRHAQPEASIVGREPGRGQLRGWTGRNQLKCN